MLWLGVAVAWSDTFKLIKYFSEREDGKDRDEYLQHTLIQAQGKEDIEEGLKLTWAKQVFNNTDKCV